MGFNIVSVSSFNPVKLDIDAKCPFLWNETVYETKMNVFYIIFDPSGFYGTYTV